MQTFEQLNKNIKEWADAKSLLKKENSFQQLAKTTEELGEVAAALCKNRPECLKDGIGDVVVTLIILAGQNGLDVVDCLEFAWNEIKDRKGKTIEGVFIKN